LGSLGELPEVDRQAEPLAQLQQRSRICVTGCASSFARAAERWLGTPPVVEQVNLEQTPTNELQR